MVSLARRRKAQRCVDLRRVHRRTPIVECNQCAIAQCRMWEAGAQGTDDTRAVQPVAFPPTSGFGITIDDEDFASPCASFLVA